MYRIPFGFRLGPLPAQSLQHGHRQRPSLILSGISQHPHQLSPAAYTAPAQQQAASMGVRHAEHQELDSAQHSGRRNAENQHMAGYLTQHSNEVQVQAHWRGISVQQTNAAMSPLSHPVYGNSTSQSAPSPTLCAYAYAPTKGPSMDVMPIPTVSPQWTSGTYQGQGQYCYSSGPSAYPHPAQMQAYQGQPYTSLALATPAEAFSLVNYPSSYVQSYLPQAHPIISNETPDGPDGSRFSMGTSGVPTSLGHLTWHNGSDGTSEMQEPKPSQRPPCPATRKPRAVGYEGDCVLLQRRCRGQGADEGAVVLLAKVFAVEVSLEALTRPLTDAEVETEEFGIRTGKVYTAFLEYTNDEEHADPRYVCRLCHGDQTWKHSKDVLRHLRRDHFGLAETCKKWCVSNRLLTF